MSLTPRELIERAGLGLPYDEKKVVRRALMHLPWRMFVRRQVDFNRESAEVIRDLTRSLRRLDRRVTRLEGLVESMAVQQRDTAAVAVREQLYETEGALRRDLSALQIEVARLTPEAP